MSVRVSATVFGVAWQAVTSRIPEDHNTRVLWRGDGPGDLCLTKCCACGEGEIGLGDLVIGEGLEFNESGLGEAG